MLNYAQQQVSIPKDKATQVIKEAFNYFKNERDISFVGEGYKDILSDTALFEEFVDQISEGLELDSKQAFRTLSENMRLDTLLEASLGGISPTASLQGTMLRKFFPKLVVKDSMPMEVAEKPDFWLSYMLPFYVDRNDVRHELPKFTRDGFKNGNLEDTTGLLPTYAGIIGEASLEDINILTGKNSAGSAVLDSGFGDEAGSSLATFMAAAVAVAGSTDKLDPNASIGVVRISLGNGFAADDIAVDTTKDTIIDVEVNIPIDINGNLYGVIDVTLPASGAVDSAALGDGYTVVSNPTAIGAGVSAGHVGEVAAGLNIKGRVMGHVDLLTGLANVALTGSAMIVGASFKAYVSSENNNYGGSVEFDIKKRQVTIGTGEHVNAAIPVEYTKDLMAMYAIDGHVKTVDLMSTYLAQKTEYEGYAFMKNSFITNRLGTGGAGYAGTFNCFPAREYAGRPQDWLEELKRIVDYYSTKIRNDSSYPGGSFVMMGNPLDVNLIKNITWSFRAGAGAEREGVEVNYSVGTYQGANLYTVISSENLPQGELRLYFYPSQDDQMTYKYYPYAFNVENGYRDPKKPNVPSIMMTKRHTFQEFTALQAVITIQNNAGSLPERSV